MLISYPFYCSYFYREEIAEMTVKDASKMTIKEIRKTNFISMALCKNLTPLVVGGIIAGSGIVVSSGKCAFLCVDDLFFLV